MEKAEDACSISYSLLILLMVEDLSWLRNLSVENRTHIDIIYTEELNSLQCFSLILYLSYAGSFSEYGLIHREIYGTLMEETKVMEKIRQVAPDAV